jgi:hypothetical protein
LCAGYYFLAIGEGDSVSVTNASYFEDNSDYSSKIVRQRRSGNVSRDPKQIYNI